MNKLKSLAATAVLLFVFVSQTQASATQVLLLTINGATSGDISSIKTQLTNLGLTYATASSSQLDNMSVTQLEGYKLIINPGGNSITMSKSITSTATARVKTAVTNGVNYLGFCAGAFMASSSSMYNYYDLLPSYLNFYKQSAIEMVTISRAGTSSIPVVYWDGPYIRNFGYVVAKYPNGYAAVSEGKVGNGFVIVSGVHPEAAYNWSCAVSGSPCVPNYTSAEASNANAYARTLIKAALAGTMLSHY